MKLIVGLGNPGDKYLLNRHNVGFMFLDHLAGDVKWQSSKTGHLEYFLQKNGDEKIEYVKPTTFMNESGRAVVYALKKHDLKPEDVVVVHDDLDIKLGEYKMQKGKGPKIHGGVLSIEKELGSIDFWRLRIGVDNREAENRIPGEAYVLQNFTSDELTILDKVFESIDLSSFFITESV